MTACDPTGEFVDLYTPLDMNEGAALCLIDQDRPAALRAATNEELYSRLRERG